MLNSTTEITLRERICRVIFPDVDRADDSGNWHPPEAVAAKYIVGGKVHEYLIYMVRIEVDVPSERAVPDSTVTEERLAVCKSEVEQVFRDAEALCHDVLSRYLDIVRVRLEQHWIGSSSSVYSSIRSEIRDAQGEVFQFDFPNPRKVVVGVSGEKGVLTLEKQTSFLADIEQGELVTLEEQLLSDAHRVGWPSSSPDYRLAIVLAAIACEMKIKRFLDRNSKADQKALVLLLLEKPRDFSASAISLYDLAIDAVCGRSLKRDSRDLYKTLDKLFQVRNSIVHNGGRGPHVPADDDAGPWLSYLRTADSAFEYLEKVESELRENEGSSRAS